MGCMNHISIKDWIINQRFLAGDSEKRSVRKPYHTFIPYQASVAVLLHHFLIDNREIDLILSPCISSTFQ
jgi:hypothetical protein